VAKIKTLGIVKMNKMMIKLFILFEMGNEHPSFFKYNKYKYKYNFAYRYKITWNKQKCVKFAILKNN
jgi:hypothetical protein